MDRMRTITITVSVASDDYEAFRSAAQRQHRPIALLIREAMAAYRAAKFGRRESFAELPTFPGVRLIEGADRDEIHSEISASSPT